MPRPRRENPSPLSAERLRELLSYNPETGEFLWKQNRGRTAVTGSIAGWIAIHGYRKITVDVKQYYAHRLAWLYVHGDWPPFDIDHINGNPSDNRIVNLRAATTSQNMTNARMRRDNKSGYKGVSYSNRDRCWRSYIRIYGRTVGLGSFKTPEEAYEAYWRAAKKHYGEFWRAA